MNFDEVRKRATLPTKRVALCLAGELADEVAQLERRYLETPAPESLGDDTRRVLAAEIEAKRAEMRESTVDFLLRALPAREWSKLWTRFPSREENEDLDVFEERRFPFFAELVSRSAVDPEMTVEEVEELCDVVHGSAWNLLVGACMGLNMSEVDVPNSVAASDLIRDSEQT